jgi:hypothetical protein
MAAAPNERWSDLPTRGLFVPLLYRSLFYLSASGSTAGDALIAGQPSELRVRTGGAGANTGSGGGSSEREPLRLVGPQRQEVIPEQRRLFGATLLKTSGRLHRLGVYDVRRGDRLVRRVALNLAPAESDVRPAAPEEAADRLADALGTDAVRVLSSQASEQGFPRVARAKPAGMPLWNVFLALALALLVAEMIVATYWTPEEA